MDAQLEAMMQNQQPLSNKGYRNVEMLSSGDGEPNLDFVFDEAMALNSSSGAMQAANQQDFIH